MTRVGLPVSLTNNYDLRYVLPAQKRQTRQRCAEQSVCGRFWHWISDELQPVHGITYRPERLEAGAQWVAKQVERQHVTALLTDPQCSTSRVISQPPGPVRRGKDMGERVGNR